MCTCTSSREEKKKRPAIAGRFLGGFEPVRSEAKAGAYNFLSLRFYKLNFLMLLALCHPHEIDTSPVAMSKPCS